MKIIQINTSDVGGGAARIVRDLFQRYDLQGHDSWLCVGKKNSGDFNVFEIPKLKEFRSVYAHAKLKIRDNIRTSRGMKHSFWRITELLWNWLASPRERWEHWRGIENFNYPGSTQLLELCPGQPDLIHTHNLHGSYFDLRALSALSKKVPLILTLHDEWMLTGHCAYTIGCDRWKQGCGSCPDLTIYPAIKRDATSYNWKRKQKIYNRSNLYVVTPSQWLMNRVTNSMMCPKLSRVIHNGVDLDIFYPPSDRHMLRNSLDLPVDAFIILAVVQKWSRFKDYDTIENALFRLSDNPVLNERKVFFLALGGSDDVDEAIGRIPIKKIPFMPDPEKVASYYQAADIFLHAANAENFPTTILESFSCGTPVIATRVGGIPEQIEHGVTGFLVPPGDSAGMTEKVIKLLEDGELRVRLGKQAAETAFRRYGLDRMVDNYLQWYEEVIADWQNNNTVERV
jgi:glycosyltransferase involved in cell wall biosynthesis